VVYSVAGSIKPSDSDGLARDPRELPNRRKVSPEPRRTLDQIGGGYAVLIAPTRGPRSPASSHCREVPNGVSQFTLPRRRPGYEEVMDTGIGVLAMTALAQAISRLSGFDVDAESLKVVVGFCGVGLLISVIFILWGLEPAAF
jgi:hypothetical protein